MENESSRKLSRIEALTNNNFDTWKLQAQAVLTRAGLWGYVSGAIGKPEENASIEEKLKWEKKTSMQNRN